MHQTIRVLAFLLFSAGLLSQAATMARNTNVRRAFEIDDGPVVNGRRSINIDNTATHATFPHRN